MSDKKGESHENHFKVFQSYVDGLPTFVCSSLPEFGFINSGTRMGLGLHHHHRLHNRAFVVAS
jgi:hypothetical protein